MRRASPPRPTASPRWPRRGAPWLAALALVVAPASGAPAAPLDASGAPDELPAALTPDAGGGPASPGPTVLSGVLSELAQIRPLAVDRAAARPAEQRPPDGVADLATPDLWTTFAAANAAPRTEADPAPARFLSTAAALLPSPQAEAPRAGAGRQAAPETGGSDPAPAASDSLLVTRAAQLPQARPVLVAAAAPPRLAAMQGQGPGGQGPPGDPCSRRPGGCPPGIPEPSTAPLVASGLGLLLALTLWRRVEGARPIGRAPGPARSGSAG